MKKLYGFLAVLMIFLNYGCERDLSSEGVSKTTNHVVFDLTGGERVTIPKGNSYADPGYKATEGESDVTSTVVIESNVNGTKVGLYKVKYSAVNSDGFPSSVERTVIIYDPAAPNVDLAGSYKSAVARAAPYTRSFTDLNVSITKIAPGFFYVSDFLGGFYDQGSNYKYGPDYAMTGYFQLNADNSISLVSSRVAAWGDSLNKLTNGKYDPVTKSITWNVDYTSTHYDFKVILDKI